MITPTLILDGSEKWMPVPIEAIVQAGAKIDGQPINSLDRLTGGRDKRIDFPHDMTQPQIDPVGYHRVAQAGGLHWHQFWTWWLYNPKKYAGFGAHEGDWEMVQLGCVDEEGEYPVLMTCSQHSGGEKREFWRVQLTNNLPAVYVAVDSHANYFAPQEDVTDRANGQGSVLDAMTIEWREFGPWCEWEGRWGNSDNSPGPLTTRRAWSAPHAWHGQARG